MRATAGRKTYHILMRVHKDIEPSVLGNAEDVNRMLDPFLIVDARPAASIASHVKT